MTNDDLYDLFDLLYVNEDTSRKPFFGMLMGKINETQREWSDKSEPPFTSFGVCNSAEKYDALSELVYEEVLDYAKRLSVGDIEVKVDLDLSRCLYNVATELARTFDVTSESDAETYPGKKYDGKWSQRMGDIKRNVSDMKPNSEETKYLYYDDLITGCVLLLLSDSLNDKSYMFSNGIICSFETFLNYYDEETTDKLARGIYWAVENIFDILPRPKGRGFPCWFSLLVLA